MCKYKKKLLLFVCVCARAYVGAQAHAKALLCVNVQISLGERPDGLFELYEMCVYVCVYMSAHCVYVCVCVCEREREIEMIHVCECGRALLV